MAFDIEAFRMSGADPKKTRTKFEFLEKIKDLNLEKKDFPNYTCFKINNYLYLRCYPTYYTIHVNGNFDYHEVKRQEYVEFRIKDNVLLSILRDESK